MLFKKNVDFPFCVLGHELLPRFNGVLVFNADLRITLAFRGIFFSRSVGRHRRSYHLMFIFSSSSYLHATLRICLPSQMGFLHRAIGMLAISYQDLAFHFPFLQKFGFLLVDLPKLYKL